MAKPEKRVRNGKVSWRIRYYAPDGKRVTETFDRQLTAQRRLTEVEHSKIVGSYLDPHAGEVRLGVWIDRWLTTQGHLKPSTRAKYEGIVERHIRPQFGTTPLDKISHSDVAAWVSGLRSPRGTTLSAGAVRYIHRVLYLILELAVKDGRLHTNPAKGVRLPKLPQTNKRFLTRDEVFRLADAAAIYPVPEVGENYRVLILLLAFTGLRWGEAAGLKVECVDLLRRRVTVAETLIEVRGKLQTSTPKNHQARQVPVPAFLADLLVGVVAGKQPGDLVFTTWRGRPMRNLNWRRDCFDKAAEDAGLAGVTPHELRHTAASLAHQAGAHLKDVQRMLGHASAALTANTYTHLFDSDLDKVAERLDGAPPARWSRNGPQAQKAEVIDLTKRRTTR